MKAKHPVIPRKLAFILLYMLIIFCVILAEMEYARRHPLEDVRKPAIAAGE